MARGQKYNDDIKERALAMLAVNNSVAFVARELGVPRTTVLSWKEAYDERACDEGDESIDELRRKNKEKFAQDAWDMVNKSMTLMNRRLTRALEREDLFDELIEQIESCPELTREDVKAACARLTALKVDSLKEISVVLGTMYDKHALASGDSTENLGGTIKITKFEDM